MSDEFVCGCVISTLSPTYKFVTDLPVAVMLEGNCIKYLRHFFKNYVNFIPLKSDIECFSDVSTLCQKHMYGINKMHLGILFAKDDQDGFDILYNKPSAMSVDFKKFADLMSIPDASFGFMVDDVPFHDYYDGINIVWYPSYGMSEGEIRQYIGNLQCIVIFSDSDEEFSTESVKELGSVNKIFIIVKSVGKYYRVSTFYREIELFAPAVSDSFLFDADTVRDYIFTKAYNGMVALKKTSGLAKMHSRPKKQSIWELIGKHNCRNL